MNRYVVIMFHVDTSAPNAEQLVEKIIEDGAVAEGFSYESIEVTDAMDVNVAVRLKE